MPLTNKRKLFVEHYLQSGNASDAAREAGYAHPGAEGHRLLKIAEIQNLVGERVETAAMDATEILERLSSGVRTSKKFDATIIKALELLGKYHALWTDRQQVEMEHSLSDRLSGQIDYALARGYDEPD